MFLLDAISFDTVSVEFCVLFHIVLFLKTISSRVDVLMFSPRGRFSFSG